MILLIASDDEVSSVENEEKTTLKIDLGPIGAQLGSKSWKRVNRVNIVQYDF